MQEKFRTNIRMLCGLDADAYSKAEWRFEPFMVEHSFAYQLRIRYKLIVGTCWKVGIDMKHTISIGEAAIPLTDVIEITADYENIFKQYV